MRVSQLKKISLSLSVLVIFSINVYSQDIQTGINTYNSGNHDKALEILLPFARQGSQDKRVYWVLFMIYSKKGNLQEAAKYGVEFLKYGSEYALTYKLTETFYALKQYDKVIRVAQYSNVKFGDKHEIYNLMGMAYFYTNRLDLAEVAVRMANTLSPDNYLYRYHYGLVMEKKGDFHAANRQLARCVSLNPQFAPGVAALARVRQRLAGTGNR